MANVHCPGTLKSLRETLCLAQAAIGWIDDLARSTRDAHIKRLGALITDIDMQRPLGPNGKHGNRHTATCGCEDVRLTIRVRFQRFRDRLRTIYRVWRTLR